MPTRPSVCLLGSYAAAITSRVTRRVKTPPVASSFSFHHIHHLNQVFFFFAGCTCSKKKGGHFFFFKVKSTSAPPTFSVTLMWASAFPRTHLVLSNLPLSISSNGQSIVAPKCLLKFVGGHAASQGTIHIHPRGHSEISLGEGEKKKEAKHLCGPTV